MKVLATSTDRLLHFNRLPTILLVVLLGLFISSHASALTVPSDGIVDVDAGLLSLPCCDLIIEGTVTVTTGRIIARNIFIRSTGTLDLGTGELVLSGEIFNEGTFNGDLGIIIYTEFPTHSIPLMGGWLMIVLGILLSLLGLQKLAQRLPASTLRARSIS